VPTIVKPLPALALGDPLEPIAGVQPSEFVFAVQYVGRPKPSTRATVQDAPAAMSP
jgi:hypothetical protein